jgi:xylulokinase
VKRYISVGGGSQSALWRQIIADVTGRPVLLSSSREASALGAAMAAAYGAGWFPDLPAAARGMASIQPGAALPDPNRHAFYTRLYDEVYCHLFPSLQPYLDRLTLLSDPSKE